MPALILWIICGVINTVIAAVIASHEKYGGGTLGALIVVGFVFGPFVTFMWIVGLWAAVSCPPEDDNADSGS